MQYNSLILYIASLVSLLTALGLFKWGLKGSSKAKVEQSWGEYILPLILSPKKAFFSLLNIRHLIHSPMLKSIDNQLNRGEIVHSQAVSRGLVFVGGSS